MSKKQKEDMTKIKFFFVAGSNQKIIKTYNYKKLSVYYSRLCLLLFLLIIGASMNNLAVNSNNGKMPIYPLAPGYTVYGDRHSGFLLEEKDKINFFYLTDIIKIKNNYFSLGDLVLFLSWSLLGIITLKAYFIKKYSVYDYYQVIKNGKIKKIKL